VEQTTPSMTGKQKRDIRRLLNDALDEMGFSSPSAQKALGNGGTLKTGVKELLAKLSVSDLLEAVGTVATPAIPTFSAKDHFKVDTSGEVKIGYVWEGFRNNFLADDGKVEADIAEATLRVHKFVKSSVDSPIIAELGGEDVAETSLAQMYEMMKTQGHGEQGILLTNGYANIFYIRDAKGVLWAAGCCWSSGIGYWGVDASPVTYPDTWDAGRQVVSR
jgi:hypothetical protein